MKKAKKVKKTITTKKTKFIIEDPPIDVLLNVDADDLYSMSKKRLEQLAIELAPMEYEADSFIDELQDLLDIEEIPEGSYLDKIKFLISKNKSKDNLIDVLESIFDSYSESNFGFELSVEERRILYEGKNRDEIISIIESSYDIYAQIEILKNLKKLKYKIPHVYEDDEDEEGYISPVEVLDDLGSKLKPQDLVKSMVGVLLL